MVDSFCFLLNRLASALCDDEFLDKDLLSALLLQASSREVKVACRYHMAMPCAVHTCKCMPFAHMTLLSITPTPTCQGGWSALAIYPCHTSVFYLPGFL